MRIPQRATCSFLGLWLCGSAALAGGSAENVVLIVDPSNPESLYVANYYAAKRDIPRGNLLFMAPTPASFAQFNAAQAEAFLGMLGNLELADHADYVVLPSGGSFFLASSGTIIDGCSPVNRFASTAPYTLINQRALLTSGTGSDLHNQYNSLGDGMRAFDSSLGWSNGNPLTSGQRYFLGAQLGYTGFNGNTLAEVLALIDRSVAADETHPSGTFYFMHTSDVARSGPRDGFYPAAVSSITGLGGAAQLQFADLPLGALDCLGIMTGLAAPDILNANLTLLPGSFCDHLTSYAATFEDTSQTKMSRWITKGASGSSGTVEEPCNYSGKFPHVRLHVYYRQGASLGEAWFRSLAFAPMQQLFTGDPLTRPFATLPVVALGGLPVGAASGTIAPVPSATTSLAGAAIASFELLVDGRSLSVCNVGGHFTCDTTTLADGWHELRVLAYDNTLVKNTGRWVGPLQVSNLGRDATLTPLATSGNLTTRFDFTVAASGATLSELRLVQGNRVVAAASAAGTLSVFGRNLGAGDVSLQLEAEFSDGKRARSAPVTLAIAYASGTPLNAPPVASSFQKHLRTDQAVVVELPASFDSDLASASWSLVSSPAQATLLGSTSSAYRIVKPNVGASGTDTLQFKVTTAGGTSNTATVTLVYDAPPSCPAIYNYCIGAPNSAGTGARMTFAGSNSYGHDNLVLDAYAAPPNKTGIFLYGRSTALAPLGDGWRCVGAPIFRLGVVTTDAFGEVVLPVDWTQAPFNAGSGWIHPGDSAYFQLWYRDPFFGPAGTNLSDGLGVPVCD